MKKRKVLVLMCLALILVAATVFAACNKTEQYTVTFSGDGVETVTQTVDDGATVTAPAGFDKVGYDTVWKNGENEFDFATPVHSDLALIATWVGKKYTVTLNAGGGAVDAPTKQVTYGSPFNLGVATTQEDKLFAGWAVNGTAVTSGTGEGIGVWNIAEDTTVNAIWKENPLMYTELPDGTYSVSAKAASEAVWPFGDAIAIPATYNNKAVTVIGSMANLTSYEIKVPASITTISENAFANNNYVEIVDLSEFSGVIGSKAFLNGSIKMIDLGQTTAIGSQAFKDSGLLALAIPATVQSIGDEALLSENIMEIGFAGNFPTLGNNVFGDGRRTDEPITVIATKTAWETLAGMTITDDNMTEFNAKITEETGLQAATMRHYSQDEIDSSIAQSGILREASAANDRKVVFRGYGLTAVLYDYNTVSFNVLYESTHLYKNLSDASARETYVFNYTDKSVVKVPANANKESIYQNVLYDYQGADLVYHVPANVTKIAGGAGLMNQTVRFVEIGDEVVEIGDYAFAWTNLFGVRFGEKTATIGEHAFFGSDYLQQIVFKSTTAPVIGTAAFCTTVGTGGIGPSILCTDLSVYADCKVFTPLSTSGWLFDPDCQPFIDALNASIANIENLPLINDEIASYKSKDFKQLTESGSYFYVADNMVELPVGTATMLGTSNEGYAYIEYAQGSGYTGHGYIRYTSLGLPGYSAYDNSDPKKLQCFFIGGNGLDSFNVNGRFNEDGFELRGDEAGSYGEVGKDTFTFDGFGKFSFFGEDGTTTEGNYTVADGTVSFDALSGTAAIDVTEKTLNYNGKVMTALGEGAGIYYDVFNAAKFTVDGKAYIDGTTQYDGKATLEYKGETLTLGYVFDGSYIKVNFKGQERSWSYSKTSKDYVFQFYYSQENYSEQLSFKVVENGLIGTFTKDSVSITVDGYYNIEMNDGTEPVKGTFVRFGESDSILARIGTQTLIICLNSSNNTFDYATAAEAGKWYTSSSANYAWYFDGMGNFLYHKGDSYAMGTYTLNQDGSIAMVYEGTAAANDEKGSLDLQNGIGTIVFNASGNNYVGISRNAFVVFTLSWGTSSSLSVSAPEISVTTGAGTTVSTTPYFYFYKTGDKVFVNTSGKPMVITELTASECTFSYTFEKEGVKFTAQFTATFANNEGIDSATVAVVGQPQIIE